MNNFSDLLGAGFGTLFFCMNSLLCFIVPLIAVGGTIFWVLMLIDAAQRRFKNENDRVLWIVIIVFGHFIGALVYYFAVKKPEELNS